MSLDTRPPSRSIDLAEVAGPLVVASYAFSVLYNVKIGGALSYLDQGLFLLSLGLLFIARGSVRFSLWAASLPLALGLIGAFSASIGFGWNRSVAGVVAVMAQHAVVLGFVAPVLRERRSLRYFTATFVGVATISAVVSILQHYSVLPLIGEASASELEGRVRATGLVGHSIWQAMLLSAAAAAAPFAIRNRALALAVTVCLGVGVWATVSRVGWLSLAAALVLWVFLRSPRSDEQIVRAMGVAVVALIIVPAIMLLGGGDAIANDATIARLDETTQSLARFQTLGAEGLETQDDLTSTETRIVLLNGAIESVVDNWTIGVGTGWREYEMYLRTGRNRTSHNTYLGTLMLLGVPLGGALLTAWFWLIGRAMRGTRHHPEWRGPAALAATMSVAMLVDEVSLTTYFLVPWVIGVALATRPGRPATAEAIST